MAASGAKSAATIKFFRPSNASSSESDESDDEDVTNSVGKRYSDTSQEYMCVVLVT